MMIGDVKDEELKDVVTSCGLKCSHHALVRIKQRLAPVDVEVFQDNLTHAYKIYKSNKARRKKKLRITRKGIITRNEYYVRIEGITYIFSGDYLVSLYI